MRNITDYFTRLHGYWENRYREGFNSGAGSYGELAEFKAKVINSFVKMNKIHSVLEFGCGDGNQLSLAEYAQYVGVDVSVAAIRLCEDQFAKDPRKHFLHSSDYKGDSAELTLSLDVIYHLLEDTVYSEYMELLFASATQFVIIYSSNMQHDPTKKITHVRHRKFTQWIDHNIVGWDMIEHIPNPHIHDSVKETGSFADFYIYSRLTS